MSSPKKAENKLKQVHKIENPKMSPNPPSPKNNLCREQKRKQHQKREKNFIFYEHNKKLKIKNRK